MVFEQPIRFTPTGKGHLAHPMQAVAIDKGQPVVVNTAANNGRAQNVAAVATLSFVGFAQDSVDNSAGAAGDTSIRVSPEGFAEISGLVRDATPNPAQREDVGKDVFLDPATNRYTVETALPNAVTIGKLASVDEAEGKYVIFYQAAGLRSS